MSGLYGWVVMVPRSGVLANVSPAPEPVPQRAGTHGNRTAVGVTAGCAGTRHNTQGDRMSTENKFSCDDPRADYVEPFFASSVAFDGPCNDGFGLAASVCHARIGDIAAEPSTAAICGPAHGNARYSNVPTGDQAGTSGRTPSTNKHDSAPARCVALCLDFVD